MAKTQMFIENKFALFLAILLVTTIVAGIAISTGNTIAAKKSRTQTIKLFKIQLDNTT